jgi:hypothetical protein
MLKSCLPLLILFLSARAPAQTDARVVSGTVLLNSPTMPAANRILDELRNVWKIKTDSVHVSDQTIVFSTPEGTVMLAFLNYPAPKNEVFTAASISWLWKNAETEATTHQAQLAISVLGSPQRAPIKLYQLFTRVVAGVLSASDASGVFMNEELLLLSKGYYLEAAQNMSDDNLPLYCWMYFGLMEEEGGKSGAFTYGMQGFDMPEMEIVQSVHSLQETHAVLYDAAVYVLKYNVRPQEGRQIPLEAGLKLPVQLSAGHYVQERETVKLIY